MEEQAAVPEQPCSREEPQTHNPQPQTAPQTHLVQHGDTFASIALKYDMEMKDLIAMNKLNRFCHLRLGQILYVAEPSTKRLRSRRQRFVENKTTREQDEQEHGDMEKESEKQPTEVMMQSKSGIARNRRLFLQFPKELQEQKEDVIKETVKYCYGKEHVWGTLTITHLRLIFEPSETDILVEKNGFLMYQLNIDTKEIFDCTEETELGQFMSSEAYVQICVMGKGSNGRILYFILSKNRVAALCEKIMGIVRRRVSLTKSAPSQLPETVAKNSQATIPLTPPAQLPYLPPIPTNTSPSSNPSQQTLQPPSPKANGSTNPNANTTKMRRESKHFWNLPSPLQASSDLLSDEDVAIIQHCLPGRQRSSEWALLYSTSCHGFSLNTFFAKVKDKGPTVIIVEDFKRYTFGAFASESWHVEERYFGTGTSFVFKLYPIQGFYLWTTRNSYFQLATEKSISMGGGEGKVGLWLNEDFSAGSSAPCETFGNTCLASAEEFEVLSVEVWGFPNSFV